MPPAAPAERAVVVVRPEPIREQPTLREQPVKRPDPVHTSRPPDIAPQPPVAVKPPQPAVVALPAATARPAVQRSTRGTTPAAPIDPLQTLRLLPSAPQGHPVEVKGVLRPTGLALFAPSKYRLVTAGESARPARTLCYIVDAGRPLDDRLGQAVVLKGRKYWIYGCREPVILVQDTP